MAQNDPTIIIIGGPRPSPGARSESRERPDHQDYQAAREAIDRAEAEGLSVEIRE